MSEEEAARHPQCLHSSLAKKVETERGEEIKGVRSRSIGNRKGKKI